MSISILWQDQQSLLNIIEIKLLFWFHLSLFVSVDTLIGLNTLLWNNHSSSCWDKEMHFFHFLLFEFWNIVEKNFACSYIDINGNRLYEKDAIYHTVIQEDTGYKMIVIDKKTGTSFPMKMTSKQLTADQSGRTQQQILVQTINRLTSQNKTIEMNTMWYSPNSNKDNLY